MSITENRPLRPTTEVTGCPYFFSITSGANNSNTDRELDTRKPNSYRASVGINGFRNIPSDSFVSTIKLREQNVFKAVESINRQDQYRQTPIETSASFPPFAPSFLGWKNDFDFSPLCTRGKSNPFVLLQSSGIMFRVFHVRADRKSNVARTSRAGIDLGDGDVPNKHGITWKKTTDDIRVSYEHDARIRLGVFYPLSCKTV